MGFSNSNIIFSNDLNSVLEGFKGNGVLYGLAVSAGVGMQVSVALGKAFANGQIIIKTGATTVAIDASHATLPRKDIIVMNSSGTISVVSGSPSAAIPASQTQLNTYQPIAPNIPPNYIVLAEIWVPAAAVSILDSYISDKRIILGGKGSFIIVAGANADKRSYADYICDGVDDQIEINAAIDWCKARGGGTVYLNMPTWSYISAPIVIKRGVNLIGQGADITAIHLVNNSNCNMIEVYDAVDGSRHSGIEGIRLSGNRNNQTSGHGIFIPESVNGFIRDVEVYNCKDWGIWMMNAAGTGGGGTTNILQDVMVNWCGYGIKIGAWSHSLLNVCSENHYGDTAIHLYKASSIHMQSIYLAGVNIVYGVKVQECTNITGINFIEENMTTSPSYIIYEVAAVGNTNSYYTGLRSASGVAGAYISAVNGYIGNHMLGSTGLTITSSAQYSGSEIMPGRLPKWVGGSEVINFNSASPRLIATIPANAVVLDIIVSISTTWDGNGTVDIGDAGNTSGYVTDANMDKGVLGWKLSDPSKKGVYLWDVGNNRSLKKFYTSNTAINATVVPGTSGFGQARVFIQYLPLGTGS